MFVVEDEDDEIQISSLFLISDFKRALGIAFNPLVVVHPFYDFERVINENKEVM